MAKKVVLAGACRTCLLYTSLLIKNVKTGEEKHLPVNGVFAAVGIHPDSELLQELAERDEQGYVIAGEDGRTSRPGIFVAGDIRKKKMRQIITAAADGANAVNSVEEYLRAQKAQSDMENEDTAVLTHEKTVVNFYKIFKKRDC